MRLNAASSQACGGGGGVYIFSQMHLHVDEARTGLQVCSCVSKHAQTNSMLHLTWASRTKTMGF